MKRQYKKRVGLFTKYYLSISATVIASLLILGVIFSGFLFDYWKSKALDATAAAVEDIADVVSRQDAASIELRFKADMPSVAASIEAYARANGCDILILDTAGNLVKTNDDCRLEALPKELESKLDAQNHYLFSDDYGTKILFADAKIVLAGEEIGSVYSIKAADGFLPYMGDILRLFILSALGSLVIAVAVAYYLVYRVYKPIAQLKQATEKIGAGDYSFRVEIDGEDEFAQLGNAFNSMARDLSALESSRRNFIANISHELKTPMTTIGGYIDAIMDGVIDADKQEHYLAIVSSEIKRLSRLVVAMLNLSKIEAGERKLEKKNVNLTAMLVEVMISFEQAIEQNRIEVIGLDKIDDIIAAVDRDMMYQVFYNLTDNAVKFTDKGGRIFVSLTQSGGKVGFRIINECSGITKEDIAKIFERFYKVDRSRNLDVQGFGLGLYIAKTIVNMHGGQITARSHEGSDCEFLFWIPG